ncbi:sensor histidine kinase [Lentibacillus saliphilus]|uniref:sensor histidine kinase n=1 Tax=Lentibacillus saliphilus TaxID=2737028 RepID=UPI001C30A44E|nr:HAMP domain-containing sensor histidine kinase [Lentibacillus saliphilus]
MGKMIKRKPGIQKRLMKIHFIVITLTVVLFECVVFFSLYQYYYKNTEQIVLSHAKNSANFATRFTDLSPYNLKHKIPDMIREFQIQGAEMQVVSPTGTILASSTGFLQEHTIDSTTLKNASIEQPSVWKGRNDETSERIMAIVVPVKFEGQPAIYFRYVTSLSNIDHAVQRLSGLAITIGLSIIVVVLLLSRALAKKITAPLSDITEASKRFARGDFDTSINENYIGELGILAKSFNEMSHALLKQEQVKDQFISSISHELRTPLTSIKGWSETLRFGDMDNHEELNTGITIITNETERLIQLVEELLDFSKVNQEVFQIDPHKFSINQLITEVSQQFDKQLKKKGIELTVYATNNVDIVADYNRLKQVFVNVLDNAIKYSHMNSSINIECAIKKNYCTVSVEDFGQGIKAADLQHIATPFYKPNNNVTGAGLGLAISKHIIERHHGQLVIDSIYEKGTKVTISLPIK